LIKFVEIEQTMAEIKDTRKERKNNAESIQLKEQLGDAK
jgi:hypothetical protein